jgi:hypothetical protein
MKILGYLTKLILGVFAGAILGVVYLIFAFLVIALSTTSLGEYEEILTNIYLYYLPIIILLTALILSQYRSFIIILIAFLTETCLWYLWTESWEHAPLLF